MLTFKNKRILVIGDVIIDSFVTCKALGLSSESPTISVEELETKRYAGGAALVTRHLLRLGATVTTLTCGTNLLRQAFYENVTSKSELERHNMCLQQADEWVDTEKKRYIVDGYRLFQTSVRNKLTSDDYSYFRMAIEDIKPDSFDLILICDNRHGVMTRQVAKLLDDSKMRYFLDSQCSKEPSNHHWYEKPALVFLNQKEYDYLYGSEYLGHDYVLKHGANGASLWTANGLKHAKGHVVHVVDTIGAGDAFLAAYAITEDLEFANAWAACSVTVEGTKVPTVDYALTQGPGWIFSEEMIQFLKEIR